MHSSHNLIICQYRADPPTLTSRWQHTVWLVADDLGKVAGRVAFLRGAGRREIGHGALAERSISFVLPSEEDWPYTMRVVSDILESNGSSSLATVCGASVSLRDAGVPLEAPVAGVASELVRDAA